MGCPRARLVGRGGLSIRLPILHPRSLLKRDSIKPDLMAGVVLGVESVPDGLAAGVLAGVNPVAGLYAYLFGMLGGALFTSTSFMAVQATGAMSIIVADVDLGARPDPARALFTLSVLTGVVMIVAGLLRLGSLLRFVSNSVMTGFITAVGINIVLGQLGDLTGSKQPGANRIVRTANLLLHPGDIDVPTLIVGLTTIALIVWLQRTRLGSLGMVVAIVVGSALAASFDHAGHQIATVGDLADVPNRLPFLTLPSLRDVPALVVPAASLAFVGLVQGAGVSAGMAGKSGETVDVSQDFLGQGAANVVAGLFQGMPVGGSMSASSLAVAAGARSRSALLYAAGVMALVTLIFAGPVGHVAMPALAGLLIVIGVGTIKPAKVRAVARTGPVPLTVMSTTLILTLIIPLQFAVLVGVAISVLLFVIRQSSRLVVRRIVYRPDGRAIEVEPPDELEAGDVVVLQPYGAIFFATATVLRDRMPRVTDSSRRAVVILRIRGVDDAGVTLLDALMLYARSLGRVGSKLVIVTDNARVVRQLHTSGTEAVIGEENIYRSTDVIGETVRHAYDDAVAWTTTPAGQP